MPTYRCSSRPGSWTWPASWPSGRRSSRMRPACSNRIASLTTCRISLPPCIASTTRATRRASTGWWSTTRLGHGCFRLRGRGAAVVTDPYPPSIGLKLQRLDANLVTVSHEHDNHNYTQIVRDAYEIRGPGEYEVAGVSVIGIPSFHDSEKGAKHGRNTIYLIEIDDVRVCHLGDLGGALDDAEAEGISAPDVLLVPVGGRRDPLRF